MNNVQGEGIDGKLAEATEVSQELFTYIIWDIGEIFFHEHSVLPTPTAFTIIKVCKTRLMLSGAGDR